MILLVQIAVHRCYTGNTVRLEGYGYGSYWLTYVSALIISALLLGVYTVRSSDRPVGPTGLSDQSEIGRAHV